MIDFILNFIGIMIIIFIIEHKREKQLIDLNNLSGWKYILILTIALLLTK